MLVARRAAPFRIKLIRIRIVLGQEMFLHRGKEDQFARADPLARKFKALFRPEWHQKPNRVAPQGLGKNRLKQLHLAKSVIGNPVGEAGIHFSRYSLPQVLVPKQFIEHERNNSVRVHASADQHQERQRDHILVGQGLALFIAGFSQTANKIIVGVPADFAARATFGANRSRTQSRPFSHVGNGDSTKPGAWPCRRPPASLWS